MRRQQHQKWLVAAALAIMPVVASHTARAQYAAGNGHALDANNRVGSGGINDSVSNGPIVTSNDLVYGNVTGGRGLSGNLREADPREFLGTLPGAGIDSFTAGSSGVPTPYSPQFSLSQPRPFYAASRGVAPPPGSVLLGGNGSGVGTDLLSANPYASTTSPDALASQRVGATNIVGVYGAPSLLSLPGSPGSPDPNMQTLLGNPVYGGVRFSSDLQQNSDLIQNQALPGSPASVAPGTLDDATLLQIRQQMQGTTAVQPGATPQGVNGDNSTGANSQSNPNANPNVTPQPGSPLSASGRTAIPGSLNGGPLEMPINSPFNASVESTQYGQPLLSTPLGTYREGNRAVPLASPAVYSPAYQQMQILINRVNPQSKAAAAAPRKGYGAGPATRPAGAGPNVPGAAVPANVEPVTITSLASGIEIKGLHDILSAGDDALKQGKYKSAIEQYTSAIRVAPNNMLFVLGRANAQLGAGYYGQAEMDIRRAVMTDPTVLMARFDLGAMMSADRLDFAKKDLQDLTKDPKASRPWFLLAYLAYNAGDTNTAATDLQEAKKRSSAKDSVILLMEKYWALPGSSPAEKPAEKTPDLNK